MEVNTKRLIVLAVVALALAACWFIFGRRKAGDNTGGGDPGHVSPDRSNLDEVIAAAKISENLAAFVRSNYKKYEGYASGKAAILEKAAENGITYEQQLVISMAYVYYLEKQPDGTWAEKQPGCRNTYKAIVERVMNM